MRIRSFLNVGEKGGIVSRFRFRIRDIWSAPHRIRGSDTLISWVYSLSTLGPPSLHETEAELCASSLEAGYGPVRSFYKHGQVFPRRMFE